MKQIPLTNRPGLYALVDDKDYHNLSQFKWKLGGSGYALRQIRIGPRSENKRRYVFMAKTVMNCDDESVVDHKDRDKLNNQKANLRVCTQLQNNRNKPKYNHATSKYFGVTPGCNGKYVAQITYEGKKLYFGTNHSSENEAALAYDLGVKKLNNEFIPLNF